MNHIEGAVAFSLSCCLVPLLLQSEAGDSSGGGYLRMSKRTTMTTINNSISNSMKLLISLLCGRPIYVFG